MSGDHPESVLWLDPGGTTGWAMLDLTKDGTYLFECGQETGTVDTGVFVDEVLEYRCDKRRHGPGDVWVGWEQYIVTSGGGKAGNPAPSLEAIGAVRYLCAKHRARVLPAVPSSHRVVASPALLKSLGWWRPGMPHAQDATRHLVAWLLRERKSRRILG